jgi:hypothetical protein
VIAGRCVRVEAGVSPAYARSYSNLVGPVIVGETRFGIHLLPGGERRQRLERWSDVPQYRQPRVGKGKDQLDTDRAARVDAVALRLGELV